MIVADTAAAARDAVDAMHVDYRMLPSVVTIADAIKTDAPGIRDTAPGYRAFFWRQGDERAAADAFRRAQHIVSLDLVNNRVVPCALEPRATVGHLDPSTGQYTLYTSSQGAHLVRDLIARHTLKIPADALRVIVQDVGGGFGSKFCHYPEEALVLFAAARLGRPLTWVGTRSEAFAADTHGLDQQSHVRAAVDAEGRILALDITSHANMGAYLSLHAPAIPSMMTGGMLSGVYAIPAIVMTCEGVYTNTVPVDAYRGAGRPEATYLIERLMDRCANAIGIDRLEIRRRNLIRPEQMPFTTATGRTYDSGDFGRNIDDAVTAAEWHGITDRQREAERRGRLRGIGMSAYIDVCGYEAEEATIRITADGFVELLIGTQSTGQGHETAYAQIAQSVLGIAGDRIRVIQGDTDRIPFGKGTSGSRSLPVGGPAVAAACRALIERATPLAARLLQADADSMTFAGGYFRRNVDVGPALALLSLHDHADPIADDPDAIQAVARYRCEAASYPNGCHICEVEVDPETGAADIVRYTVVDEFGTIVNPLLLAGQIQGGVAQGIGQAMMERAVYDPDSGDLVSRSFATYGIPRARDVPAIEPNFNTVPSQANPLGIKGAGEAGAVAACPAVINAIVDALRPLGVRHIDMPATPETIWRAIQAARSSRDKDIPS